MANLSSRWLRSSYTSGLPLSRRSLTFSAPLARSIVKAEAKASSQAAESPADPSRSLKELGQDAYLAQEARSSVPSDSPQTILVFGWMDASLKAIHAVLFLNRTALC
jgi:hypothetical protein